MLKKTFTIFKFFLVAVFLAGIFLLVFSTLPVFGKNKLLVVLSGSMEPAIKTGSIVLISPQKSSVPGPKFALGDIISYKIADSNNFLTHRVVQVQKPNSSYLYQTKGDANSTIDGKLINEKNIAGKVVFSLPFLGFIIGFAKTKLGLVLLVILPALYVLASEVLTIIREVKKKQLHPLPQVSLPVVLAFLSLTFFQTSQTQAFFTDSGQSLDNIITTSQFAPPIAQTLVINEVLPVSSCDLGGDKQANWVEMWNGTNATVNLKDFKISDGTNITDLVTSNTLLPSHQFALIAKDNSVFNRGSSKGSKCYPDNDAITINLGNTSPVTFTTGILKILASDGVTVIDKVQFNGTFDGVNLTPQTDQSIERVPLGHDSVTGDNFLGTDFIIRETPTPGYGSILLLNEFVANPGTTFATEWVEIYNPGPESVNLSSWSLEDNSNHNKNISALGTIGLGEFKVKEEAEGWLNNTGGDWIFLKDSAGKIIDSHSYSGTISDDQSIGREDDMGNIWQSCTTPTKGGSNNGSC